MKIRILSDIHLEFHQFTVPAQFDDKDTVLVLAGDIGLPYYHGEPNQTFYNFFGRCGQQFKAVIYVLGNHEYYHGMYGDTLDEVRQNFKDCGYHNVHILERQTAVIDNVAFIGATLWTDYEKASPTSMMLSGKALNDHRLIKIHKIDVDEETGIRTPYIDRFTVEEAYKDHVLSRKYIFEQVEQAHIDGNVPVVVVHHGVSFESVHERFRGEPARQYNGAFVSDLSQEILDTKPTLVIHGHVHNKFDYMIGNTRVIANPRGYPGENDEFDPNLTLEV